MIRKAELADKETVAELMCRLWPHHTREEMLPEAESLLADRKAGVFLAFWEEDAIGFAQCQLRNDYVEGTESSPVGYLEGIFVAPGHRKQGAAGKLLEACQRWAKEKGCREFASDCELENTQSLHFHLHSGFQEAGRIICFVKKL